MSIVQGQTTSFKYQLFNGGVFNLSTDNIYMALYTGLANLNLSTTAYSSVNEVVGTGYTAGGKLMTGLTINYDATAGNASIAVIDFGSDKSCSNSFTVTMPANSSSTALIRSA